MTDTSASLLEILRDRPDEAHWRRLVDLYSPLIRYWLHRHTIAAADTDDLVQEVLTVVIRRIPEFHRRPQTGAFRCWLKTITGNCLRDFWRTKKIRPQATGQTDFDDMLQQLEDPASGLSREWDTEHDRWVTRRLLELLRPEFTEKTWLAFRGTAVEGRSPDDVAATLGITVNAVFIARSRIMARLREEARGLVE
jgi:RNA polymerase sigma-70 factor (ECF subfamily)